jgi:hypothetical protein
MFSIEILMIVLAIVCFLGGYGKGRLSGFNKGLEEGLKIGKESAQQTVARDLPTDNDLPRLIICPTCGTGLGIEED